MMIQQAGKYIYSREYKSENISYLYHLLIHTRNSIVNKNAIQSTHKYGLHNVVIVLFINFITKKHNSKQNYEYYDDTCYYVMCYCVNEK